MRGLLIKDGTYYAMTAKHVITEDGFAYRVFTVRTPSRQAYIKGSQDYVSNDEYYNIMPVLHVEYVHEDADLAVVSFKSDDDLAVASLSKDVPVKGERASVIGNPEGEKFKTTFGKIKSSLVEFKADGEPYSAADCLMKEDSPSCGSHFIYDGTFTDTKIEGHGMAVEKLRNAGFKIFSEDEIEAAAEYLEEVDD